MISCRPRPLPHSSLSPTCLRHHHHRQYSRVPSSSNWLSDDTQQQGTVNANKIPGHSVHQITSHFPQFPSKQEYIKQQNVREDEMKAFDAQRAANFQQQKSGEGGRQAQFRRPPTLKQVEARAHEQDGHLTAEELQAVSDFTRPLRTILESSGGAAGQDATGGQSQKGALLQAYRGSISTLQSKSFWPLSMPPVEEYGVGNATLSGQPGSQSEMGFDATGATSPVGKGPLTLRPPEPLPKPPSTTFFSPRPSFVATHIRLLLYVKALRHRLHSLGVHKNAEDSHSPSVTQSLGLTSNAGGIWRGGQMKRGGKDMIRERLGNKLIKDNGITIKGSEVRVGNVIYVKGGTNGLGKSSWATLKATGERVFIMDSSKSKLFGGGPKSSGGRVPSWDQTWKSRSSLSRAFKHPSLPPEKAMMTPRPTDMDLGLGGKGAGTEGAAGQALSGTQYGSILDLCNELAGLIPSCVLADLYQRWWFKRQTKCWRVGLARLKLKAKLELREKRPEDSLDVKGAQALEGWLKEKGLKIPERPKEPISLTKATISVLGNFQKGSKGSENTINAALEANPKPPTSARSKSRRLKSGVDGFEDPFPELENPRLDGWGREREERMKSTGGIDEYGRAYARGRRKESSARVWMIPAFAGSGTSKGGEGQGQKPHGAELAMEDGEKLPVAGSNGLVPTGASSPSLSASLNPPNLGRVLINNVSPASFSPSSTHQALLLRPLKITKQLGSYNVFALSQGGGLTGQTGAVAMAMSRCLVMLGEREGEGRGGERKRVLRKAGLLKRDPRMVERKKPGRPKARKAYAWVRR